MMLAFNDYGIAGISRGACIHICFYWFGFSFWASKLWTVWLLVSVAHPPLTLLQNVPPCLTTRSALISHCANIDSSNIGKSYSGTSSFSQLAKLFYAFMLSTEMSKNYANICKSKSSTGNLFIVLQTFQCTLTSPPLRWHHKPGSLPKIHSDVLQPDFASLFTSLFVCLVQVLLLPKYILRTCTNNINTSVFSIFVQRLRYQLLQTWEDEMILLINGIVWTGWEKEKM